MKARRKTSAGAATATVLRRRKAQETRRTHVARPPHQPKRVHHVQPLARIPLGVNILDDPAPAPMPPADQRDRNAGLLGFRSSS